MALVVVVLGAENISCYQTLHTGFRRIPTILKTAKWSSHLSSHCYPITNMGPYGRQSRSTILRARTAKCELKCELELAFWLLNLHVPYNLASVLGHFLNNNEVL